VFRDLEEKGSKTKKNTKDDCFYLKRIRGIIWNYEKAIEIFIQKSFKKYQI
jgi:hypothetical protein